MRSSYFVLALHSVLLCVAYYLSSLLGYALLLPSSYISIVWPPNTVLLVALVVSAQKQWPWLLLIVFPVHILSETQHGVGLVHATLFYVYDCVLVLTVAAAMRRYALSGLALPDLRQTVIFLAVTTGATALASLLWSPLIVWLWIGGDIWAQWHLVFLSNLLPFLIATPGLVAAVARGGELVQRASAKQCIEFGVLALSLLVCGLSLFGLDPQAVGNVPALLWAPLPILLWAAVRFGPSGLSVSFLAFALMAIFSSVTWPFVTESPGTSVLWLKVFLLALYVPLLVLAADVQERRVKEAALRESEARYRAVVEDQTELICRFLPDGTYTFVNSAYCRYFQTSPEELLGRTFWTFLPPEEHQGARDFLASITPDNPVATREHEVLAPGGEVRWQQWRDRGLFDARGRVVEYQAVGRDITERRRVVAEVEERRKEVTHLTRVAILGELSGALAHELNQPLTAILSNAQAAQRLLAKHPVDIEEVREILSDISSDDKRAGKVITRLRALMTKGDAKFLPVNLNDLASDVLELAHSELVERNVAVTTRLTPGLPAIRGDRVQLQQVLLNLIMNACEAMSDTDGSDRSLVVSTTHDGDSKLRLMVADRGPGISSDLGDRIFEPFVTTKTQGLGLGLSICRSIVAAHGGKLWTVNNVDSGASFFVSLPIDVGGHA